MQHAMLRLAHVATHILCAALCAMIWKAITQGQLDELTLGVALLGSLLPDLDVSTSLMGRLLPPLSRFLESRLGHRQEFHTLWPPLLVWGLSLLPPAGGWAVYLQASAVGFFSHLLVDTFNPAGIAFLLPLSKARIILLGGKVHIGKPSEVVLAVVLAVGVLVAAIFTRFEAGQLFQNALPSMDTAREQYRRWENAYYVYANVEGTWNETHQPYTGQVEVLGVDPGGALNLRDLNSNQVFTAGQHPIDEMYILTIRLRKGQPRLLMTQQPVTPTPLPPLPLPTPVIVSIWVEGVRDPDFEILVRVGDVISKGQHLAELLPLASVYDLPALLAASPSLTSTLAVAIAQAELDLARAEYRLALEGQPPNEAAILQAEASIAALNYLLANHPELSYVPQQIAALQARLEELRQWKGPSAGEVGVAKANLALAELRYQQAVLTPTPPPTPPPATPPPPRIVTSMLNGVVRHIQFNRIVGNLATIEIQVEVEP